MKKGTIFHIGGIWKIDSAGTQINVLLILGLPENAHGRTVEFDDTGGYVHTIIFNGKTYTQAQPVEQRTEINHRNSQRQDNHQLANRPQRKPARAPYNFVPLNEKLVKAPDTEFKFSSFQNGLHSGYIDLFITSKTPLFIRGKNEYFTMINNRPIIPGSSLRGMTRTLAEIASYGKFVNYDDRELYHRKEGPRAAISRKIGFLFKDHESFFISEAAEAPVLLAQTNFPEFKYELEKVNLAFWVKIFSGKMMGNFKIAYNKGSNKYPVDKETIESYQNDDGRKAREEMKDLIDSAGKDNSLKTNSLRLNIPYIGIPVWYEINSEDKLIHFGHCKNYRIPYGKKIGDYDHIPEYLQDSQNPNAQKKIDFAESIFGTTERAGRVFFEDGIIQNEAKYYDTSVLQILSGPKPTTYLHYLKQPEGINYPSDRLKKWGDENAPISGYKLYWHRKTTKESDPLSWQASDITIKREDFSEYLKLVKGKSITESAKFLKDNASQIQSDENNLEKLIIKGNLGELNEQVKKTVIDFFNLDNHIAEKHKITKPQNALATCIKENTEFKSRIRFDNLSPKELGCLLFVLKLPEGCFHKIGMGKPLGLGSVKIEPELVIINREERYKNLFENGSWKTGTDKSQSDILTYQNIFAADIGQKLEKVFSKDKAADSLWEEKRMKELKKILEWDETKVSKPEWLQKTSYMGLDEFRDRLVLPVPTQV